MKVVLLVLLVFWCQASSFAQEGDTTDFIPAEEQTASESSRHTLLDPEQLETTRTYQSELFTVRRFDAKMWKEIVGGEDKSVNQVRDDPDPKSCIIQFFVDICRSI